MKTSKITLSVAAIMLAMAVSVISCKKKDNTPDPADDETSSASDNSMAERTSNDATLMFSQASEIAVGDSLSSFRSAGEDVFGMSCATVVRDFVNKIITITFSGTCLDGRTRSGSLIGDYSQSTLGATYYRHPGYKCVVTSSNYVVDGTQISINKTITNTTPSGFDSTTTNMTWSISSTISIVKASNGGTVSWTCNKTKTLLNTSDTAVYHGQLIPISWNKARIGITGNSSGTTAGGESFTANATSQLVRDMTCSPSASTYPGWHPFIQGAIDFTPGSRATRHIDYGNGACDNLATVTVNGVSFTITIP